MPNVGEISVAFTGQAGGLESAANQAAAALQRFGQSAQASGGQVLGANAQMANSFGSLASAFNPAVVAAEAAGIAILGALIGIGVAVEGVKLAFEGLVAVIQPSVEEAMKFEEAFSNVRKVLEVPQGQDSGTFFKRMSDDLIKLSTQIPVAATELAKIEAAGAQMNIAPENLNKFTEVVARLGAVAESKNIDQLALDLGRLQAITQSSEQDFGKLASTTVALARALKTDESSILRAATTFGAMGTRAGLSAPQVLALAGAVTNLDRRVQTGGTSMQRMLQTYFATLSDLGSHTKELDGFARVLSVLPDYVGKTNAQIAELAKNNPGKVFEDFVRALPDFEKSGGNFVQIMAQLGFTGARMGSTFSNLSMGAKEVAQAFEIADKEWENGTAILDSSNARWDTASQRLAQIKNDVTAAAIVFGQTFLPAINQVARAFEPVAQQLVVVAGQLATALTPAVTAAAVAIGTTLADAFRGALGVVSLFTGAFASVEGFFNKSPFWAGAFRGFSTVVVEALKAMLHGFAMLIPGMNVVLAGFEAMTGYGASLRDRDKQAEGPAVSGKGGNASTVKLFTPDSDDAQYQAMLAAGLKEAGNKPKDSEVKRKPTAADKEAAKDAKAYESALRQVEEALAAVEVKGMSAYDAMVAGADNARDKTLEAAMAAGVHGQALEDLKTKAEQLRDATVAQGTDDFITKVFGPGLHEASEGLQDLYNGFLLTNGGAELTKKQLEEAVKKFGELSKEGPGAFKALDAAIPGATAKLRDFVLQAAMANATTRKLTTRDLTSPDIDKPKVYDLSDNLQKSPEQLAKDNEAALKRMTDAQKAAGAEVTKYNDLLRSSNELMKALGISADSTLGRLISGFAVAGKVAADMKALRVQFAKSVDEDGQSHGFDFGKMAKDPGAIVAGLASIVGAFKQATDSASGFQRAMGGAMLGAQLGSQFAGPWGAAIGAAIGGIAGLFHKPSWAGVGKEAGQILGVEVGKEMAQQIEKLSKSLHISVASASLLKLPDVMKDSGKNVSEFSTQIDALMRGIVDKSIPAAEGIKSLGEAFSQVKEQAESMGGAANAELVHMIQQARQLGTMTKEMTAYVNEQIDKAVSGLGSVWGDVTEHTSKNKNGKPTTTSYEVQGGLKINTEEDAKASAVIFASVFGAALKTKGIIAATAALKDVFAKLKDNLKAGGFGDIATTMLAPIQKFFDYADNDAFKGAANSAQGLADAMSGLAQAGYLSQEAFEAFGHSAVSGYQQAMAATNDEKASIMSQMPLLIALKKAHDELGYQYSEEEKTLMGIAEAQGIAFPTDPIIQVRDAIYELIEAITGVPREISVNTNFTTTGTPPGAGAAGGGGGGEGPGFEKPENGAEHHASLGFYSPRLPKDTLIQAHAGEPVAIGQAAWGRPMGDGGMVSGGGTAQGGPIHYAPNVTVSVPNTNASPRDVAAAVELALRNNMNGLATQINRAMKNSKGGRA